MAKYILFFSFLFSFYAYGAVFKNGLIEVHNPIVRGTYPGASVTAAYFLIINGGQKDLKIVNAKSMIAKTVEIHIHKSENGIMKMRKLNFALVPKKGKLSFKSGGHHLMLIGLKGHLKKGELIPLSLTFENGEKIDFKALIN